MSPVALHHQGLQVSDIDRAGAFYVDALGGEWLARPVTFEGAGAEQAMGHDGVRMKLALIGFPGGGAVELFQLLEPALPDWARRPRDARLPHLGLQVDDVDATLARVEAAGGRRLWPAVDRWGRARVVYVADPDGNVVELLDHPPSDIAAALIRWFPEAAPR
ncbi:MAG TPA: VOC family protein [Baekduia sp.]|uniref:VOC family protein n=1 Tax=Baekduia sp. TaxID=2600305 RepID=UPI002D7974A3|nr:VOC family protein [Baekduia sp.]HET6507039.1 VOC family protein [Baekduia sp.]